MAIPPAQESTTESKTVAIELDEEIEGESIGSRNYRFSRIGEPVPIKSGPDSGFDPECLPSQPLAVSERFRLLFVAHSDGFCVARTKEAIASAEEFKEKNTGRSIQELSFVDLNIGKVSVLALSADDSVLAATVGSRIHFFAVSALLYKEQKPSFSLSLDDSSCVKDLRWSRKFEKVYVMLSTDGKLYQGSGQGSLNYLTENVDSVDWNVKGNLVAIARKNVISILSSQFKEVSSMLLPFKSVIGDSDVNQVIKVDSIRWVRPDCIVVGCFLLNGEGEEENYLVQAITSKTGKITDVSASSKPIVLYFDNVFLDFRPNDVPAASGPHLFLGYLDHHGLAFIANRKNLAQHVVLFSWSTDNGKSEATMIEILNDAWIPHLECQADGEDNLILGLAVDKVSQNENVEFTLGDEETEVSPCCVLACLTVDGKISVFHFASAIGASVSSEYLTDSDEDGDYSQASSFKHEPAQISLEVKREKVKEQAFPRAESYDLSRNGTDKRENEIISTVAKAQPLNLNIKSEDQGTRSLTWSSGKVDSSKGSDERSSLHSIPNVERGFYNKSDAVDSDEDGDYSQVSSFKHEPAQISSEVKKEKVEEQAFPRVESYDFSRNGADKRENETISTVAKAQPLNLNIKSEDQGTRSLTWSSGKGDSSKVSDERTSLHSSPNVECGFYNKSDTVASKLARDTVRDTSHIKERTGPSVAFNSSGQRFATGTEIMHSLPAHRASQVPLQGSYSSGKPFDAQPKKEIHASRSPMGSLYSEPNASKQFSNVEEMANKLNNLLEGIEGKGGFKDASVSAQEESVKELEDGTWALSDRCRMWERIMDRQQRLVQLLLDKTAQVLARKVYVEGIFKQATDSRYRDLWNRQKLSPELELKRRHILDLDQELTNQMIDLERHFNALELNKFGESREMQANRKSLQSWRGQSRHIQELHSLHNTMSAQLAAAEQLSECLSKQMAVLNIESAAKEQGVKNKLFESIGLSYVGATHRSPSKQRTLDTLSNKEVSVTSHSVCAKEKSARGQANPAKGYEPETVRRRRDSLDQSWSRIEPPKTTVKRMLLDEDGDFSANRSLFPGNKQDLTPQCQKGPRVSRSAPSHLSTASSFQSKNRGTPQIPEDQSIESSSSSMAQWTSVKPLSTKTSILTSQSALEPKTTRDTAQGTHRLTDEKSSTLPFVGKNDLSAANEDIFVPQSMVHLGQTPPLTLKFAGQTPTKLKDSGEISVCDDKKLGSPTISNDNHIAAKTGNSLFEPNFLSSTSSTFGSGFSLSRNELHTGNSLNKSQPSIAASFSTSLQPTSRSSLESVGSSSLFPSFLSNLSPPTVSPAFPPNTKTNIDASYKASQSQTSVSSPLKFPSTSSFPSADPSVFQPKHESPKSSSQPPVVMFGTKTDGISPNQASTANLSSTIEGSTTTQASSSKVELAVPVSDSRVEPSGSSASESSMKSKSGIQIDFGSMLSSSIDVESNIKTEQPYPADAPLETAVSTAEAVPGVKPVTSDASHEDEMEEEAPESDQTTELTFQNLGGFGLGSVPNSTATSSNPFGVAVVSRDVASASSPFTMSAPSGELFRPASFNFQSLQTSQASQPTSVGSFSGGFNTGNTSPVSAVSGFGQPARIGSGQEMLGSVLGGFGQSRQLGGGLTATSAASASAFGSGFMGVSSGGFGGGFASASTGGGFANLASGGGGFASAATGGGFSSLASGGGGFGGFAAAVTGGGGFSGAATAAAGFSGGGFGAFGNQQGSGGGFSAFGGSSGAGRPPSNFFTDIRK